MRGSIEMFGSGAKREQLESKEKEGEYICLEIGAGCSRSPLLNEENIENYEGAHIIRSELWVGNESREERNKMEIKYGGFGGSGNLLAAKENDKRQIDKLGNRFKGIIDYIKCGAEQLPLGNESVNEIYIANVFSAPGFWRQKENKEKIIKETARVLKKGGELIIAETYTPQIALEGIDRGSKRKHFEKALTIFANEFTSYGYIIKTIEFPKYSERAYRERIKGLSDDKYLSHYPYGRKMFGKNFPPYPASPNPDYKFIIVLTKE